MADAARKLEQRGELQRLRNRDQNAERLVAHMSDLLGAPIPSDLADFYREAVAAIGDFSAFTPHWNDWVGWGKNEWHLTQLLPGGAVPVFNDGCGNLFGLDLTSGEAVPAVYFFDHEVSDGFLKPAYCAGSCLGAFLLLLADHDRAQDENWSPKWELEIDPDIDNCPRARAIWAAG